MERNNRFAVGGTAGPCVKDTGPGAVPTREAYTSGLPYPPPPGVSTVTTSPS